MGLEKIGSGAFGVVYKSTSPNGLVVAVKRMKIDKGVHYTIIREIAMGNYLLHANIIRVLEFKYKTTMVELTMQYGGVDLREYIYTSPFQARINYIDRFKQQIMDALQYMHSCGVVHRDLKPDNILIDRQGIIRICDMGLTKYIEVQEIKHYNQLDEYSGPLTKEVCTVNYRAPELFDEDVTTYTSSIDVWSLGCIFYEYITRSYLFSGITDKIIYQKIKEFNPNGVGEKIKEYNSSKANEYTQLILGFCNPNPENRLSLPPTNNPPIMKYFTRGEIKIKELIRDTRVQYIFDKENTESVCRMTLLGAVDIFDQYVALTKLPSNVIQQLQIADACVLISSKIHSELIPAAAGEIIRAEKLILKKAKDILPITIIQAIGVSLLYRDLNTTDNEVWWSIKEYMLKYENLKNKNIKDIQYYFQQK